MPYEINTVLKITKNNAGHGFPIGEKVKILRYEGEDHNHGGIYRTEAVLNGRRYIVFESDVCPIVELKKFHKDEVCVFDDSDNCLGEATK